jgi:hypothetical protein
MKKVTLLSKKKIRTLLERAITQSLASIKLGSGSKRLSKAIQKAIADIAAAAKKDLKKSLRTKTKKAKTTLTRVKRRVNG